MIYVIIYLYAVKEAMNMEKVGLVLEGGGMRGAYTCGALEYLMDKELYFKYIIGVSAGACNAASYISRQKGRNQKISINFVNDPRYLSFRNLLKEKSVFGMNFIFDEIPNKHVLFDYETFYNAQCKFIVGATDCNTGKPVYFNKEDVNGNFDALRASASLPLVSPIVNFKDYELLDGGISDSIPIRKSIADGNTKNIIVLTRNKEYRKSPVKYGNILKFKYKKYPLLVETMMNRYIQYNETLDFIDKLEAEGKVIVIRPSAKLQVGRLEKDTKKLNDLFQNGYEDLKNSYEKIISFIGAMPVQEV